MDKYLDPDVPLEERISDLISRMTLDEKIDQMGYVSGAIPRLGIPVYTYWNEALHGVARNGRATVFPQAIGMAATWNPDLIEQVASAIGDEGRAKYHQAVREHGFSDWYQGLTFWTPNVNIFRDPRWGRGQETWGEDPYLTGEMGAAFVRGLQGRHPTYLKAAACAKHFAVHSGPEASRHTFDAAPSEHDLRETYLPAFKTLVTQARVEAVMGAYNRVYGEPCCASRRLLSDILRGEWGFEGHVVSDCGAITDFHATHQVTSGPVESAALAVRSGCDLACDGVIGNLRQAIQQGLITEAEIDRSLARTLRTRFKLGMFDPPERVPYSAIPYSIVDCEEHRRLAREAAVQSIVLLKNKDHLLPLTPATRSIAVVGPNAASLDPLLGNYAGMSARMVTLLEGIVEGAPATTRVEYRAAVPLNQPIANLSSWTGSEGAGFDVVIVCAGLSPLLEGEEGDAILSKSGDRTDLSLPPAQVDYIKRLAAYGGRTVLVVNGGSPMILTEVKDLVDAIIYLWYPGEEGGHALADVLFGRRSPAGKLPVTFPQSMQDLPAFDDYDMSRRTYRYSNALPLFQFGFGLSYSTFEFHHPTRTISDNDTPPVKVTFTLTNTGCMAAAEVVQAYLTALDCPFTTPHYQLVFFKRVELQAGQSQQIEIPLDFEQLSVVDETGQRRLSPGRTILSIGGCSPSVNSPAPLVVEIPGLKEK